MRLINWTDVRTDCNENNAYVAIPCQVPQATHPTAMDVIPEQYTHECLSPDHALEAFHMDTIGLEKLGRHIVRLGTLCAQSKWGYTIP